jgi:mRNA-degrading endonuclease toxin of MazEF toxin-antitoxin module
MMAQGEIWLIKSVGRTRTLLIVQADYITDAELSANDDVFCVHLDEALYVPETILSVRVGHLVADVRTLAAFRRERFTEQVGHAAPEEVEAVKAGLSTLLNL